MRARPSPAVERRALERVPLFRGLGAAELSRVASLLRLQTVPAASRVVAEGDPADAVYVVVRGTVAVQVESPEGRGVVLAILGPGEIIGEMSAVDSMGRSATVETIERCTLVWMDREAFWDCLRAMPTMTYNLAEVLSRRLRVANAHIQALATLDIPGRVAWQIVALAEEYGQPSPDGTLIPLCLPQRVLAGLVGASRVRVAQVMASYQRRGCISVDAHSRITVHDPAALAQRSR